MPQADLFAAVRWWATLLIIGTAALPLTFVLFQRLPDRGYAFVKLIGLLIVSYVFWLLGSFGFLDNSTGGILVGLGVLAGLSIWAYVAYARRAPQAGTLPDWIRAQRGQILLTEAVFLAIFALWVWVRAQNPAITATEKPMEFAFLNSVGRSPQFPPGDPWLSGFAISYYYFGYVMTSVIARLAAVAEPVAFNLGIAWLVAGTAVAAFGLVFNLLRAQGARRSAIVLGLAAALAIPIAGNLEVALEVAHANGIGPAAFWEWLDVRDLNTPPNADAPARYDSSAWWWWRSSRVIHEYHLSGRSEEGLEPIAEFPGFSFVLGDMHPHVLALPFALLSLAVAFVWYGESSQARRSEPEGAVASGERNALVADLQALLTNPPLWLFTAVLLGGLSFLNTWDVLIHLFVVLGAFFLGQWRAGRDRRWTRTALLALLLVIPAVLLYLPFYLGFRSQAGAPYLLPMLMRPTRLSHFLVIFGMPLFVVGLLLVSEAARRRFRHWQSGLLTAVGLLLGLFLLLALFSWIVASSAEGGARTANLAAELGIALPERPPAPLAPGWGLQALVALLPAVLGNRLAYPWLTLLLAGLAGLVVMIWRTDLARAGDAAPSEPDSNRTLPFVLLLILTAVLLTLGPEFVYLRDNFGFRLNTIFKFYYQAWAMFGTAALIGLGFMWLDDRGAQRAVAAVATAGYAIALALALLFPYLAVSSRAQEYRGSFTADNRAPATLNGLAYIERFNPDEYAALMWLRENVPDTAVILEAVGGQYSGYARVSANTGLPTVLGWPGHEYQWRGATPEPAEREPAVAEIYTQTRLDNVAPFLDRYDVAYIYVGGLERDTYGMQGLDKFSAALDVAFENGSVTIYRWERR